MTTANQQELKDVLDRLMKDFKDDPYFIEREKMRGDFERLKRGKYKLSKLFENGKSVCDECIVNPACTRSHKDKTICKNYIKQIRRILHED